MTEKTPPRLQTSQGGWRPMTDAERTQGAAFLRRLERQVARMGWRSGGWEHADGRRSLPAHVATCRGGSLSAQKNGDDRGYRAGRAALGNATEPGPWRELGEAIAPWAVARLTRWEEREGRTEKDVRRLIVRALTILSKEKTDEPERHTEGQHADI